MNLNAKVVLLLPGFPKNEEDTNCLPYIQDLVLLLQEKFEPNCIEIISFQYPFSSSYYLWNNIPVHAIGGKNKKGLIKLITWWRVLNRLRKINKEKKIDVIHSFWLNDTTLIGQIFSRFYKTKTMATIVGQDPTNINKYLKILPLDKIRIIGISQFVSDKLFENTGVKADDIIPLVWHENQFNNLNKNADSFDVLGVGNLYPLKNYPLFIDVIERLVSNKPDIKSAIIGGGVQDLELKKIVIDKGLENNISFLGELNRGDVFSIMQHSKVLLHTSHYESQGFAMSEALYLGMKVTTTPVSDMKTNPNVDVGEDLLELTTLVLKNLNENKRKRIIYYSPSKAIDQYLFHYKEMISEQ